MSHVVAFHEDTADLKLRVGLHSGPVVAGVLRGDRSRFQLFGDTVSAVLSHKQISFVCH
jgi:class 3 adenylate cyclase